jgi:hypothetical protein
MRATFVVLVSAMAFAVGVARAATETLENIQAFERAYATSYYMFDACADTKHGRIFRQALVDRFKQCSFTPAAKESFRVRTAMLREKLGAKIFAMIEANGGLLVQVEGMPLTCREQKAVPEYVALTATLEKYTAGQASAQDVLPTPCDADTITP